MKWQTFFFSIITFSMLGLVTTAQAQVEKADIRVDGLSCPFCAYGLEKKLKKIEGVGKVEINVDKAVAMLENKQGKSIEVEGIELAVKNAGFTPKQLTVSVVGTISQADEAPVLLVSEADDKFILQENEQLKNLRSMVKRPEDRVRVTGEIEHETPEKHHVHPYTLTIQEFEVIK